MITAAKLLSQAKKDINFSASAWLDAEMLLCHVMRYDRAKIYVNLEQFIPDDKLTTFESLIKQRQQGHPIAHLIGKKEFWSLELAISKDTFIVRPETELLVDIALQIIPDDAPFRILDLGTGNGAIAIAIASEKPHCTITATDISMDALTIAKKNATTHKLKNIRFYRSHWYLNIPPQSFDLIVSNPPYIRQDDIHLSQGDVRFEPKLALVAGIDGMQAINAILKNAGRYLAKGASILIEHGYDQKPSVCASFLKYGFRQIKTFHDLSGHDRITYGQSPQ